MKLLLYCTKGKPYLVYGSKFDGGSFIDKYCLTRGYSKQQADKIWGSLNGKIVAECDYEIKDLKYSEELLKKSCLTASEIFNYIKNSNTAYEIHIKNLNIYKSPRELSSYTCVKAPQNMQYVYTCYDKNEYALISIQPQWICKILNGEKTIVVRKKVLRGML